MLLSARPIIGHVIVGLVVQQMVHKIGLATRPQAAKVGFRPQPPLNLVIIPLHVIAIPGNVAHGTHVRVVDHKVGNV